jgi:hypothetical protein
MRKPWMAIGALGFILVVGSGQDHYHSAYGFLEISGYSRRIHPTRITPTNSFTASALLFSAACSSGVSLI